MGPLPRKLPPLTSLRAFEAASRRMSFLKASEELRVTPGAISQQVKSLEEWLGVQLFRRQTRGVLLTDAGQRLGAELGELLDRLEKTVAQAKVPQKSNTLTVSTLPSFSARWLIPRLGRLQARHPEVDVRILVSTEPVDMAIRYGKGVYPGLKSEFLFRDSHLAVASPELLKGPVPLKRPEDLAKHTLLHEEFDSYALGEIDWPDWFRAAKVRKPDLRRGLRFAYTHMVIQAALAGQGVGLAPSSFVAEDLASGRLVHLFGISVPSPHGFHLVCPEERADDSLIKAFWSWAKDEAAGDIQGN
jgi:LysR family glycine cleavage system transcriptional activator